MAARVTPKKTAKKTNGRKTGVRHSSAAQNSPASDLAVYLRRHSGMIVLVVTAVLTGILLFTGYRAATAAAVFELKYLDIKGENRIVREDIQQIVRRQTAKTGVWNADVDAIRAELEKNSWVKSAVVSRVLPDGLRVRVTERTPLFAVKTTDGKTIWIDDETRTLGALTNDERAEAPLLLNWTETVSDATRKANISRLQVMRDVRDAARSLGIADKLHSVDAGELQEIKVFVKIGEDIVPIFLGADDFAPRLKRGWAAAEAESEKMLTLSHVSHLIAHEKNISIVTKTVGAELKENKAKSSAPVVAAPTKKTPEIVKKAEPLKTNEPKKSEKAEKSSAANETKKKDDKAKKP